MLISLSEDELELESELEDELLDRDSKSDRSSNSLFTSGDTNTEKPLFSFTVHIGEGKNARYIESHGKSNPIYHRHLLILWSIKFALE
jgi:hypothetical protein